MKYLLFANNNDLIHFKHKYILLNFLNPEDIIVTFNHCVPMDCIIKTIDHKNIYHFSRRSFNMTPPYSGLHYIDDNKHLFKKIFLWPHPDSLGDDPDKQPIREYIKEKTSLQPNEIHHMPGFGNHILTKHAKDFLSTRYNNVINLSMGLIGYLYIQQTKRPEDEIFLIGFTHHMHSEKHNAPAERDFFIIEKEKGLCRMIPLIL